MSQIDRSSRRPPLAQPSTLPPPRFGPILIIDYEPSIVEMLRIVLGHHGYATSILTNDAAMDAVVYAPPALILLDVERCRRLGGGVVDALRATGIAPPPIVMLTTASPFRPPLPILAAIDVLYKPFTLRDVLTCVERITRWK